MATKKAAAPDKAVTDDAPEAVQEVEPTTVAPAPAKPQGLTLDQQQVIAAMNAGA